MADVKQNENKQKKGKGTSQAGGMQHQNNPSTQSVYFVKHPGLQR